MIAFEIDPNVVRPGWTPLIITVLLAVVMVFLYRSMKTQFGRIRHLPTEAEARAARMAARRQANGDSTATGPGSDGSAVAGTESPTVVSGASASGDPGRGSDPS